MTGIMDKMEESNEQKYLKQRYITLQTGEELFNLCHLQLQLSPALLEILKYPILDLQEQDHKRKEDPVHHKET